MFDILLFSAGESGGALQDMYVVNSHDVAMLWALSLPFGGTFSMNPGPYRVFETSATTTGNIGGISGADNMCNTDIYRPDVNVMYKAMIVDGVSRQACTTVNCGTGGVSEHIDWVFEPLTQYLRSDTGAVIQTADTNGLLPFNFSVAMGANSIWTGMHNTDDWVTDTAHCTNWTSTGTSGALGNASLLTNTVLGNGSVACTTAIRLLCVEQSGF